MDVNASSRTDTRIAPILNPAIRALMLWGALLCHGCGGKADPISIHDDPQAGISTITVETQEGRLNWADVLRALARAKGFDDTALADILPDARIDLNSAPIRLTVVALNLTLAPELNLNIIPGETPHDHPVLQIKLNRRAFLASERWLKRRLRDAFQGRRDDGTGDDGDRFRLTLSPGWEEISPELPLVIIVHGLQSTPEFYPPLVEELKTGGFAVGIMSYPNDQPLADSARLLSAELHKLAAQQPSRTVSLVAVSMGGLVARAVIEDPDLDPGNVLRFIMVGTPNHGSKLAEFAFALEVWEHLVEERDRQRTEQFYSAIEDGLGEAYQDLTPESEFLTQLNARPRNPAVTYSIILGSGAFLDDDTVVRLRESMLHMCEKNRFVRFLGPRLDQLLEDLDEVVQGQGDGLVAVSRGKLEGVEDVVILPFNHLTMLTDVPIPVEKQLREEILKRLTQPSHPGH